MLCPFMCATFCDVLGCLDDCPHVPEGEINRNAIDDPRDTSFESEIAEKICAAHRNRNKNIELYFSGSIITSLPIHLVIGR